MILDIQPLELWGTASVVEVTQSVVFCDDSLRWLVHKVTSYKARPYELQDRHPGGNGVWTEDRRTMSRGQRTKKQKRKVGDGSPESILDSMGAEGGFRGPQLQSHGEGSLTTFPAFSPSSPKSWKCAPWQSTCLYSSMDWFCFNVDCTELQKTLGSVVCLVLRNFLLWSQESSSGGAAGTDAPQRPSRLSQQPQTLTSVLLFASTKCGAFQKTFNFLCCYSVAIVN